MDIRDFFGGIRIGDALGSEGLQAFPLILPRDDELTCALLDELLEQGLAEITEVNAGGSVPELAVENRSDRDALILDGMELHGAKQNRMVNLTLILPKKSRTTIPVSCVERGRWSYRRPSFSYSGRTVSSGLRRSKSESVLASLKVSGKANADQMAVWNEVDDYLHMSGARSNTDALNDAFARQEKNLRRIREDLSALDAHGVVVAIGGRIAGLDLMTHRGRFGRLWPGLLDGYAMEALVFAGPRDRQTDAGTVSDWIARATSSATLTRHEVPGIGEYHECRSDTAAGGIVTHLGAIVHAMLYPVADAAGREGTSGGSREA